MPGLCTFNVLLPPLLTNQAGRLENVSEWVDAIVRIIGNTSPRLVGSDLGSDPTLEMLWYLPAARRSRHIRIHRLIDGVAHRIFIGYFIRGHIWPPFLT
jgi:hypothetical protein